MLHYHLRLALRHLRRQWPFTALNMLGLAIGIGACWIIWRITTYEFSFDAEHPAGDRIYRVVTRFEFEGKETANAGAPWPLAVALGAEASGYERLVPVSERFVPRVQALAPDGSAGPAFEAVEGVVATNARYFELVPYRWLAGNPARAFAQPREVVLTRSRAERYFPNQTPEQVLGRTLLYSDTLLLQVSGVVADLEQPSNFSAKEFCSVAAHPYKTNPKYWGGCSSGDQLFVELPTGADPRALEAKINELADRHSGSELALDRIRRWHLLQPLSDLHFNPDYTGRARLAHKPTLYGLMAVAAFLLLLACINFVNLATAQAPGRAREIAVQKTMGSRRRPLMVQFLAETALVTLGAALLSYAGVAAFFRYFESFVPDEIPAIDRVGPSLAFLAVLCAVVALLSGLYPGWVLARFQPVRMLRGEAAMPVAGGRRVTLRKALIVFQFAVAQFFIIGAVMIGRQLQFGLDKDLGFEKEAIVTFEMPFKVLLSDSDNNRRFTLQQELARIPGVASVSLGDPPSSPDYSSNIHFFEGTQGRREFNLYRKNVDTALLSTYRLQLLAGRNLLPGDTASEYVINESCLRAMGLTDPREAIGLVLQENRGSRMPIVGVVRDFHSFSLHEPIVPTALAVSKLNFSKFNVRFASSRPSDWQPTLAQMERVWAAAYPGFPFEYTFFDDSLRAFYEAESRLSRIINLATLVAILISCLGLFGLATLTAWQRTKEIGIRKVLGASVASIMALLSRDFLRLVLLAVVLASPLAWWAVQRWLADFAYRVDFPWWIFAASGAAAALLALATVSVQGVRAALADPVDSLRRE